MLEKEVDFVPVSSLNIPAERVFFAGNFPEWLDLDKIALNLKRTQTICNLGGIGTLIIWGSNEEETSKSIPQIAGFNASGEAYASKAATATQAPTFNTRTGTPNSETSHPFRQIVAGITLNNNEIVQRIQNNRGSQGDVRSTDAWVHYINKSLGRGLENIGVKYLVAGLNRGDILETVIDYTLPIPIIAGVYGFKLVGESNSPDFTTPYLFYYGGSLFSTSLRRVLNHGRLSLFYGPQLDRAAMLVALTRTSKLVKLLS